MAIDFNNYIRTFTRISLLIRKMDLKDKYTIIKARHGLKEKDIAQMFGYKSTQSFRNTTARQKYIEGIVKFYEATNGEVI